MFRQLLQWIRGSYISLGIEISDLSIKIVALNIRRNQPPVVEQVLEELLPMDTVDDGKIKNQLQLIQTLQTVFARLEVKPAFLHGVMPSQLIMVRFIRLPNVSERDTRRMVEFDVKHNIHLPFQNPMFDMIKVNGQSTEIRTGFSGVQTWLQRNLQSMSQYFNMVKPQDQLIADVNESQSTENLCDIMLVATSRDFVEGYAEAIRTAKVEIHSMEIKALSILRYIEKSRIIDPESTFLLIDINALTTDLTIFHGGFVGITRNVPINFQETEVTIVDVAGNDALAMALQISRDAAFQTHCNDLAYEVERLMSFYRYSLNHQQFEKFDHILLIGEMSRLKEASVYLARSLSVEVQVLRASFVEHSEKLQNRFSSYAVALGLALRGNER